MNTRRNFLKLGALFVPAAIIAPRVAYSFLRPRDDLWQWFEREMLRRKVLMTNHPDPMQNGVWIIEEGFWRRPTNFDGPGRIASVL